MIRVFSFLISIALAYGFVSEVAEKEIQPITTESWNAASRLWQNVTTEVTGALK